MLCSLYFGQNEPKATEIHLRVVTVTGPRHEVERFVNEVKSLSTEAVSVELKPSAPSDPLSRRPFGQYELVEAILTVVTSVASPIATAELKELINKWRKRTNGSGLRIEPDEDTSSSSQD